MSKRIIELYETYFQKSRVFLLAMLEFKRTVLTLPENTYVQWENKYTVNDKKLLVEYKKTNNPDFKIFERNSLLKSKYFEYNVELENGNILYVFDFREFEDCFNKVINSKYSKIKEEDKRKIKAFVGNRNKKNYHYILSYLYPERYYEEYAELLCVDSRDIPSMIETLKEAGELCEAFNLEKETLKLKEKKNEVDEINFNQMGR